MELQVALALSDPTAGTGAVSCVGHVVRLVGDPEGDPQGFAVAIDDYAFQPAGEVSSREGDRKIGQCPVRDSGTLVPPTNTLQSVGSLKSVQSGLRSRPCGAPGPGRPIAR